MGAAKDRQGEACDARWVVAAARLSVLATALVCALAVGLNPPVVAAEDQPIRGRVTFKSNDKVVSAGEHRAGTVVYFTPDEPVEPAGGGQGVEITMEGKEFLPRVTHALPGSVVRFPNRDPISHNVFSVSPGNSFDLGLYRRGEGEAVTLGQPGTVQVFCNVHHEMAASILVIETPFVTGLAADASFIIEGVSGAGRLTVWNDRAEPVEVPLTAAPGAVLDVEVEIARGRVPRHRNKFGKRYGRGRRDRDYQ